MDDEIIFVLAQEMPGPGSKAFKAVRQGEARTLDGRLDPNGIFEIGIDRLALLLIDNRHRVDSIIPSSECIEDGVDPARRKLENGTHAQLASLCHSIEIAIAILKQAAKDRAPPIKLTPKEWQELERLTKADKTSVRKFVIARALLRYGKRWTGVWKVADVAAALDITTPNMEYFKRRVSGDGAEA